VSPYKIDIVQGNFVSKEQADALKVGMSRTQVRDILGTPLLASMFHADRWDYVFTFKRQGAESQARKVSVYFSGDTLARFEADTLPTETEFVATLDSGRRTGKVPILQASEESLAKFASEAKVAPATDAKLLPPLPERYPPLEPAKQ
jgi:outer membrane protein assembly factor BamE